jgi:hypothetical protein
MRTEAVRARHAYACETQAGKQERSIHEAAAQQRGVERRCARQYSNPVTVNMNLAEDDREVRTQTPVSFMHTSAVARSLASGAMFIDNPQHITGKKKKKFLSLAREFPRGLADPQEENSSIMAIKAGHTPDGIVLERGGGLDLKVLCHTGQWSLAC